MKNWKFLALMFAVASTVAIAQPGTGHRGHKGGEKANPEARATKMTETMTEKLALTAEQREKVGKLNLSRITQMKEVKKVYGEDKESFKAKVKAIQEDYRKEMKATLTAEQLTKLKECRKELQANRPQKAEMMRNKDAEFLEGIE